MNDRLPAGSPILGRVWRTLTAGLLGLLAPAIGLATPGDLDPSFGGTGIIVTDVGPNLLGASGVAVQADGKVVVVSYTGSPSAEDFLVVRYTADGALDPSFGSGGFVGTDFGGGSDYASDVAVQPDGKIVVSGGASFGGESYFAVARYNADGTLDPSFNLDGRATNNLAPGQETAHALALRPEGRIEVVGSVGWPPGIGFTTFTPDGTPLYSGVVQPRQYTEAFGVVVQPDGKVVAAGYSKDSPAADSELAVVRLNDPSFGDNGLETLDVGPFDDVAEAIAVQPDGRIVVAGRSATCMGECYQPLLVRFLADGSLDASFGGDGMVDLSGTAGALYGVVIQEDGKIVAAGSDAFDRLLVARLLPTGALDTAFGGAGIVTTDVADGKEQAVDLALQSDGRIVVAGRYNLNNVASRQIAVARYLGSPCDAPRPGCRAAATSMLAIRNDADDSKDQLIWKWLKGPATSQGEFGDPTDTTAYHLCVYAGTVNAVLADVSVGYGAGRWSPVSDKGYKYKSPAGPITAMKLKGGADGKAKILLKGKGAGLPDPTLGSLPVPITAQLITTTSGTCFEAVYDPGDVSRNEATQLKAKTR